MTPEQAADLREVLRRTAQQWLATRLPGGFVFLSLAEEIADAGLHLAAQRIGVRVQAGSVEISDQRPDKP